MNDYGGKSLLHPFARITLEIRIESQGQQKSK